MRSQYQPYSDKAGDVFSRQGKQVAETYLYRQLADMRTLIARYSPRLALELYMSEKVQCAARRKPAEDLGWRARSGGCGRVQMGATSARF